MTESDLDRIAQKAAKVALEHVYAEVGRSVIKKITWLAGLVVVGLCMWLAGNGSLPK